MGAGYAGPAVAGALVVHYHRIANDDVVDCRAAETGRVVWQSRAPSSYRDRFDFNNGPRASPVIDGNRVYVHSAEGHLQCLDLGTGRVQWKHNTNQDYNITATFFGVGATPLVRGDALIVPVGAPGPGVVAYDKFTGEIKWSVQDEWAASYASPVSAKIGDREWLFVFAGGDSRPPTGGLLAIDPTAGRIADRFPWRAKRYESVNAATPLVICNTVFITAAYGTGGALLEVKADGSLEPKWTTQALKAHWATPVARGGFLYGFDGDGQGDTQLTCVDLATGESRWREDLEWTTTLERDGEKKELTFNLGRGSLLYADGAYLALGEMGDLAWLELSPAGCKTISHARLFAARETYTLPVLSRGLLYVCQNMKDRISGRGTRLLCYDLRGE